MKKKTTDSIPIFSTSIGDSLNLLSKNKNHSILAHVFGLVTRVNKRKNTIFIVITDGTAKIQLVAEICKFEKIEWNQIREIREKNLIEVNGEVKYTIQKRPSIFLSKVPAVSPVLPANKWPNVTQLGHQILLAQVKKIASKHLDENKFLEISPNFISTAWNETTIPSLKVTYPGFGVPVHLAPTSSTQLLRAISTTGYPKIYAVSKCFTTAYKSEYDGTESDIISLKILNGKLSDVMPLAKTTIELIFDQMISAPETKFVLPEIIPEIHCDEILSKKQESINQPIIYRSNMPPFTDDLFGKRSIEIFAYSIPFKRFNSKTQLLEQDGSCVVVCDGAEELFEDELKLASLTIHLNRLVKLIHDFRYPEIVPAFRTLSDLGS